MVVGWYLLASFCRLCSVYAFFIQALLVRFWILSKVWSLAFIGTNFSSTAFEAGWYYLSIYQQGFFEGGPNGSPDLIFILQQYLSVPFGAKLQLSEVEQLATQTEVFLKVLVVALPLYGPCLAARLLE